MTDSKPSGRRILVVTRNLPPLVGGMERLLHNAIRELASTFEVAVIGPKGCEQALPDVHTVTGIDPYPLWRFLVSSLISGLLIGRRFRPHFVFAGSGLTAPIALLISRLTGSKSVVQLHGLDLVARNWGYRLFFVTSLPRVDAVIVNSHNTAHLASARHIPADRIHVVHPGIRMPEAGAGKNNRSFLIDNDLVDKRVLLSVGRLTARKGLSEFIKRCIPDIIRHYPDTVLLIAGAAPKDALKREKDETAQIHQAISTTGAHHHVRLLGSVSDEELELCYQSSDIFVFPAIPVDGDVEGFGIVAIEAASRGVPTVAFAVGGITDAVEDGCSGYLIEAHDYAQFTKKVIALMDYPAAISRDSCIHHARKFNVAHFGEQLRTVFARVQVQGQ